MVYAFGSFEADTDRFELTLAGAPVPIQRKTFDLLIYLLGKRGGIASREQLVADVWDGVAVSETALNQAVMMLRKLLGDDGKTPRMVQTVRGRGYRFIAEVEERATAAGDAPPAAVVRSRSPLVGREACMTTLEGALARALAGSGGLAIVIGEAGIGKTRVVDELERSITAPARVVRGHSYGREGAPALWPWMQIVRELAAAPSVSEALARDALAALSEDRELDPAARFRFSDLVARLVREVSARTPLLLVLEDAHDSDCATLELANVLAPSLPACAALLVITSRDVSTTGDADRWTTALGKLARLDVVSMIHLPPLTRDDLARLLADVTGRAPTEATLDRVVSKTGGNPLFFQQIARVLRAEVSAPGEAPTSALLAAEPVRAAIALHVASLPEETRDVLAVASVFGDDFPLRALALTLGVAPAMAADRLDAAVRGNVVRKSGPTGTDERLRFVHALVRDVLYKGLGASERARLHGAVAEALARLDDDAGAARHCEAALALLSSGAEPSTEEIAIRALLEAARMRLCAAS
jgi:predicted ATPase/DNA-binding winged helix-turn-helix (wHTH) protein